MRRRILRLCATPASPAAARRLGGAAALLALLLLLALCGAPAFHYDEIITWNATRLDWRALTEDRIAAAHAPLYFWAVKPLADLTGDAESLRWPSSALAAAALGLGTAMIARRVSRGAALLFALGLALTPGFVYFGTFARPYALLLLCATIGFTAMAEIFRAPHGGRRPFVALSAAATLGAATLMIGVLHAVAIAATPLLIGRLRRDRRFLRRWARATAPPLLVAGVMTALLYDAVAGRVGRYWTETYLPMRADTLWDALSSPLLGAFADARDGLLLLGVGALTLWAAIAARGPGRALLLAAAPVGLLTPLALIGASFVTSLLAPRYFAAMIVPLWALAALGAQLLWRRGPRRAAMIALGLLLAGLSAQPGDYGVRARPSEGAQAARIIAAAPQRPERVVIAGGPTLAHFLAFELNARRRPDAPYALREAPSDRAAFGRFLGEAVATDGPVWLVVHRWDDRGRRAPEGLRFCDFAVRGPRVILVQLIEAAPCPRRS